MRGDLIFETVHGSHLYGLDHADSDRDVYKVYEGSGKGLKQSIYEGVDVVRGDLPAFIERATSGSHQSCEALFSSVKTWMPGMEAKYGAYLSGFRVGGGEVFKKYERTITKFSYGDFKRRRHACRLRFNLGELREFGRFEPRLTQSQVNWCNKHAELEGDELRTLLLGWR